MGYGGRGPRDSEMPSLQELVSGDLIAGALLALLLSFVFKPEILQLFIHPQGAAITTCTVSWPIGLCMGGAGYA